MSDCAFVCGDRIKKSEQKKPDAYSETMGNRLNFCPVVCTHQYCKGDAEGEKKTMFKLQALTCR